MGARAGDHRSPKLLIDEMWPAAVADQLRRYGVDALAAGERSDLRGQPDEAVFEVAQAEGRAVVTENVLDFRPLAARRLEAGSGHAGLVQTTNRRFPRRDDRTVGRVVTALRELAESRTDLTNREFWLR